MKKTLTASKTGYASPANANGQKVSGLTLDAEYESKSRKIKKALRTRKKIFITLVFLRPFSLSSIIFVAVIKENVALLRCKASVSGAAYFIQDRINSFLACFFIMQVFIITQRTVFFYNFHFLSGKQIFYSFSCSLQKCSRT